jgi:hemoglobin
LGRREGIYHIMSKSIDSLHNNDQLNSQNQKLLPAMARVDPNDLKRKLTDYICVRAGGPCVYTGRTMKSSHDHLDITEADWKLFVDDTVRLLTELAVPAREGKELLAILEADKSSIVKGG